MLQDFEQTRAAVRSSISKASTISDEEQQLALTKDDFDVDFSFCWLNHVGSW